MAFKRKEEPEDFESVAGAVVEEPPVADAPPVETTLYPTAADLEVTFAAQKLAKEQRELAHLIRTNATVAKLVEELRVLKERAGKK